MNNSTLMYRKMLADKLNSIQNKINVLNARNSRIFDKYADIQIEGLRRQYEEVSNELKNLDERIALSDKAEAIMSKLDDKSSDVGLRISERAQAISELQAIKSQLSTRRGVRKINRQIERQQNIIRLLQRKNVCIGAVQRAMMFPKYYKMQKRMQLLNLQHAKVNYMAGMAHDLKFLQSTLRPEEKLGDHVKAFIYDIQGRYYQRQMDHAIEVLDIMNEQSSNILMRGARCVTVSKKVTEKLRERMRQGRETAEDLVNNMTDSEGISLAASK